MALWNPNRSMCAIKGVIDIISLGSYSYENLVYTRQEKILAIGLPKYLVLIDAYWKTKLATIPATGTARSKWNVFNDCYTSRIKHFRDHGLDDQSIDHLTHEVAYLKARQAVISTKISQILMQT